MIKKILYWPVILGMACFTQCTDDPTDPLQGTYKAKGGNGGGGGHTETLANNLSFPAFLADGYVLAETEENAFTVPYTGTFSGLTDEEIALIQDDTWYAQKTEGNIWQADIVNVEEVLDIDWIDWGDAIEAVDPKIRRPYRLELTLYVDDLDPPMEGYTMTVLEYPSSQDELQGTNTVKYTSAVASVASTGGKIVVQWIEGLKPELLTWDGSKWAEASPPVPLSFSVENNIAGKLIFGASVKGWKPTQLGDYRITFYLANSVLNLGNAQIGNYTGSGFDEVTPETAENNCPVVVAGEGYSLSYVDVTVEEGGGSGN